MTSFADESTQGIVRSFDELGVPRRKLLEVEPRALRWLDAVAVTVLQLLNTKAGGTPQLAFEKEHELQHVRSYITNHVAQLRNRPELTFWTDWLAEVLAYGARRVDRLRASQQKERPIPVSADDVLLVVAAHLATKFDDLTRCQRQALTACPVQYRRFVVPGIEIVVRVPREFLPTIAGEQKGWSSHVLGQVRPMTAQAWRLYERLVAGRYGWVDAYSAAADSVGRLDGDTIRLLEPLIRAHVPADQLIDTAAELAR